MNKVERYSLHSGLKISKPFVNDCFFPIIHDKYITFHSEEKLGGRKYDYWQEVIDLISPILKENDIKIIQIGKKKSHQFDKVYSVRGLVNFNQEAYIIKGSLLHFGADGYQIQLSSHHDIPMVALYSTEHSSSAKPIWGDFKKQELVDSPKGGKRPSYVPEENPKTINKISPFEVASKILNSLKIKHNFADNKIIYIGKDYHIGTIETVPDFKPEQNLLKNSVLNLRMDLCHEEENLIHWADGRRLGVFINKPVSPNILLGIRPSILRLSIEINDSFDHDFLKFLKSYLIPYELFLKNKSDLKKYRLEYIDETVKLYEPFLKKDLDKADEICDTTLFKSSKTILSKGKKYQSLAHWIVDEPHEGKPQKIINTEDFWQDGEHYLIYNEEIENGKGKTKGE